MTRLMVKYRSGRSSLVPLGSLPYIVRMRKIHMCPFPALFLNNRHTSLDTVSALVVFADKDCTYRFSSQVGIRKMDLQMLYNCHIWAHCQMLDHPLIFQFCCLQSEFECSFYCTELPRGFKKQANGKLTEDEIANVGKISVVIRTNSLLEL